MEWKKKIYDYAGNLVYEGQYSEGQKNGYGKGIERDCSGKKEFKGEYYKGKEWNGYIKEYNDRGKLIFEGEYSQGAKNGNGKEYNGYGNIIFEGKYRDGEKNGIGKEYDERGKLIYEGEYLNGKVYIEALEENLNKYSDL